MSRLAIFIFYLLTPILSIGQEWAFYSVDNSHQRVFKEKQVKSLQVLTKEYKGNGDLKGKYIELTQTLDRNGMIVWEKKLYNDSTVAWEANYQYNNNQQVVLSNWAMPSRDFVEKTEYEYDSKNKLIKSCLYHKASIDDDFDEFMDFGCNKYHYRNDSLVKVTNSDDIVLSYYETSRDTILSYDHNKNLKHKYINNQPVYFRVLDSIIFHFERNEIGQPLKATKTDHQEDVKSISIHEYSNRLLTKVTTKNKLGVLLKTEEYEYTYYD